MLHNTCFRWFQGAKAPCLSLLLPWQGDLSPCSRGLQQVDIHYACSETISERDYSYEYGSVIWGQQKSPLLF